MKLKYKPAIEIAIQQALKYTLELNEYDELQRKYNIEFNTIVADCEGCLPQVIDHISTSSPSLQPKSSSRVFA